MWAGLSLQTPVRQTRLVSEVGISSPTQTCHPCRSVSEKKFCMYHKNGRLSPESGKLYIFSPATSHFLPLSATGSLPFSAVVFTPCTDRRHTTASEGCLYAYHILRRGLCCERQKRNATATEIQSVCCGCCIEANFFAVSR